jgi:hypothetical protein
LSDNTYSPSSPEKKSGDTDNNELNFDADESAQDQGRDNNSGVLLKPNKNDNSMTIFDSNFKESMPSHTE